MKAPVDLHVVTILSVSKYPGNLRFRVMYPYMHVQTGDMIGADVFHNICVSFQST